jgi:murein tripeptide amidase MpaA
VYKLKRADEESEGGGLTTETSEEEVTTLVGTGAALNESASAATDLDLGSFLNLDALSTAGEEEDAETAAEESAEVVEVFVLTI